MRLTRKFSGRNTRDIEEVNWRLLWMRTMGELQLLINNRCYRLAPYIKQRDEIRDLYVSCVVKVVLLWRKKKTIECLRGRQKVP